MNIGPRQQRLRLAGGVVMTVVTAAVAVAIEASDATRGWRLLVFLPALLTAVLFLQVKARTCVALAAQGLCHLDSGVTRVTDEQQRRESLAIARNIASRALIAATLVTALFAAVP